MKFMIFALLYIIIPIILSAIEIKELPKQPTKFDYKFFKIKQWYYYMLTIITFIAIICVVIHFVPSL